MICCAASFLHWWPGHPACSSCALVCMQMCMRNPLADLPAVHSCPLSLPAHSPANGAGPSHMGASPPGKTQPGAPHAEVLTISHEHEESEDEESGVQTDSSGVGAGGGKEGWEGGSLKAAAGAAAAGKLLRVKGGWKLSVDDTRLAPSPRLPINLSAATR